MGGAPRTAVATFIAVAVCSGQAAASQDPPHQDDGWYVIPDPPASDAPPQVSRSRPRQEADQEPPGAAADATYPFHLGYPSMPMLLGLGYSHPAGDVSRRHGPGAALQVSIGYMDGRLGGGLDILLLYSADSEERIVVPEGLEGNEEAIRLDSEPSAWLLGPGFRAALVKTEHWLLQLGLTLGYVRSEVEFLEETGEDGDGGEYEGLFADYRRLRRGIGLVETLTLSYRWNVSRTLALGPYLAVGLMESRTWNAGGAHPDLGRADPTEFGIELWPFVLSGLYAQVSESPPTAAKEPPGGEVEPYFFRTSFGMGYSHPLGEIGLRQPPGAELDGQILLRCDWLEIGLDLAVRLSMSETEQVSLAADSPRNPHTREWELPSDPQSVVVAVVWNPLVLDWGVLALTAGIRLGYARHMIGRGEDVTALDGGTFGFDDYRRVRHGLALGERAELLVFLLRRGSEGVFLSVLLRLDECWTAADGDVQPDLGERDLRTYGTELWPSVSLGLGGSF